MSHNLRPKRGVPALTLGVAVLFTAHALYNGRSEDIFSVKNRPPRLTLNDAVKTWNMDGNCPGCRDPIIVIASGGASRAAYVTGSVLGLLRDERVLGEQFKKRLFAVSATSGGAVGAAFYVAADISAGPCKDESAYDDAKHGLWFEPTKENLLGLRDESIQTGWRRCLELLAVDDFLSPTLLSMAFSDWNAGDRAGVLRQAWNESAKSQLGRSALEDGFLNDVTSVETSWRPMLLFNAASVFEGRRVVISQLAHQYEVKGEARRELFPTAIDFYTQYAGNNLDRDISLGMAASLSSRFPVVSAEEVMPSGDRLVDGGYVDYSGAVTALELLRAFNDVSPDLKPIVILITNDPKEHLPINDDCRMSHPESSDFQLNVLQKLVGVLAVPWEAASNARTGKGQQDLFDLCRFMQTREGDHGKRLIHFYVGPLVKEGSRVHTAEDEKQRARQAGDLTMSWWLSKPVQDYLHGRIDAQREAGVTRLRNLLGIEQAASDNATP